MIHLSAAYAGAEGTLQADFPTLQEASEAVCRLAGGTDKDHRLSAALTLEEGEYTLTAPVSFDADQTPGLANTSLSLTGDGKVLLSSCVTLDNAAFTREGAYYVYRFSPDKDGAFPRFRDFYVDGKRLPICRSGMFIHPFPLDGTNNRRNAANLEGIYLPKEVAEALPAGELFPMELTMYVEWEFFIVRLHGVDFSRTKTDAEGKEYVLGLCVPEEVEGFATRMNRCLQPTNRQTFLGNHKAFLTPGTWCYDHTQGVLCYYPADTLEGHTHAVPTLENLLIFRGMDGITLKNLTFTGATSKFVCDNGYFSGQANCEARMGKLQHSALLTRSVRHFTAEGCAFRELGGNGLIMLDSSIVVRITRNTFADIGMAALSIGNPTTAWEDPINRNVDVAVENNLFRHIGYEYPSAVAFYISMVDRLHLCHNTFRETAYSAISIGWGWVQVPWSLGEKVNIRQAEVAYNRIVDYMQVLRDGAAIYVVGCNCNKEYGEQFNFMHHNYAQRELFDQSKRGYYLDGSSSNWSVHDCVTSGTPHPVFSQFHVPAQYTWHNRIDRIYTTEPVPEGNHHPERDTLLGEWFLEETLPELLAKYPAAKEIRDASGCDFEETIA